MAKETLEFPMSMATSIALMMNVE